MLRLIDVGWKSETRWILKHISCEFNRGEFWGIVGPNGSGKSTMLRLMSGELTASSGKVELAGDDVSEMSAYELARKRAVLVQKGELRFPFRVKEVIRFGQFHLGGQESDDMLGHAMTPEEIMETCEISELADRIYPTLSGGEACRVDVARIIAQQTPILLLDEPTNHLDPKHQVAVLSMCRRFAAQGALVIVVLHDLNLAAQYTDKLLMMQDGEVVASGEPTEVLQPERLSDVYGIPFVVLYHNEQPFVLAYDQTK